MSLTRARKLRGRLDVDLPRSAELVEVVDVVRAQIDLEGVEHIAQRHSQRHALGPIDLQVQPGRLGAGTGEQSLQTRRLVSFFDHFVGGLLQWSQTQVAPVLDQQLETARGAQAVDRRRPKTPMRASRIFSRKR